MKTLLFAISLAATSICIHAQTNAAKERDAKLVSQVKQLPVSELDPLLPVLPFEKWLNIEAGSDAKIRWRVSDCAEESQTALEKRDRPLCVEVEANMKDGRVLSVLIEVGTIHKPSSTQARLFASQLITPGETISIPRLSDLPLALVRTHRLANYPEMAQ